MGFFDFLRRRPKYLYLKNEVEVLEEYIEKTYGKFDEVFHELKSPDIHLDIYVVKPTDQNPYYQLITVGVGAYQMQVPDEFKGLGMDRVELVTFLPPDWNVKSPAEVDYWPIRMMKQVGRISIAHNTWIGEGHSFSSEDGMPYAENTKLNSCFLIYAGAYTGEKHSILLPTGKKVVFLQIIPLYPEELKFKMENGTYALAQCLDEQGINLIIDPKRKNVCK